MANKKMIFLASTLIFLSSKGRAEPLPVKFLNYHDFAPFVVNQEKGLSSDLALLLTQLSNNKYTFSVETLPRKRLDALVAKQAFDAVLWASPHFFSDPEKKNYHWSASLFPDGNALIFNTKSNWKYQKKDTPAESLASSLKGFTVSTQRGFRYSFDNLFMQKIAYRDDVDYPRQVFEKVRAKRTIVGVLPQSAAKSYMKDSNGEVGIVDELASRFERHLFTNKNKPELAAFFDEQINSPAFRSKFETMLQDYYSTLK